MQYISPCKFNTKMLCCCWWPDRVTHLSIISAAAAEIASSSAEATKDHSEDSNVA